LRGLATERANSSRFPRSVEVISQNATLPVAFSENDGADMVLMSDQGTTADPAGTLAGGGGGCIKF
jgi:hypothetical protein